MMVQPFAEFEKFNVTAHKRVRLKPNELSNVPNADQKRQKPAQGTHVRVDLAASTFNLNEINKAES